MTLVACTCLLVERIWTIKVRVSGTWSRLLQETPGKICRKTRKSFKLLCCGNAVRHACAVMPGVPSNHQFSKACVFGYMAVSKLNDGELREIFCRATVKELPHHIVHQPHNAQSIGEGVQVRQLHKTIVGKARERPAQSVVDPMHKQVDGVNFFFWQGDRLGSSLFKTSSQIRREKS